MPETPQVERLIAEVAARHGILLKKDDAAFALVTLNQLVLEAAIADLAEQTRAAMADFEVAMERVQARAGAAMAKDVKELIRSLTGQFAIPAQSHSEIPSANARASWYLFGAFVAGIAVGVLLCWAI